jgi:cell pole-organizing protein PopZ
MSASTPTSPGTPPAPAASGAADPSMEDILASIRRILSDDEAEAASPAAAKTEADNVLELDSTMIVAEPAAATPTEAPPPPQTPPQAAAPSSGGLVAPAAAAAAASSVGSLVRTLIAEREQVATHRGGPTIEDVVREEIRPLLKQWLDTNLPQLVERLVRLEIERVVGRASS